MVRNAIAVFLTITLVAMGLANSSVASGAGNSLNRAMTSAAITEITKQTSSESIAQVDESVAQIRAWVDTGHVSIELWRQWLPNLMTGKRYQDVADISIAAALIRPDGLAPLASLRAQALLAIGKPQDALQYAKVYYNVSATKDTPIAVDLVASCLAAAYPNDGDIVRRFRDEQALVLLPNSSTRPSIDSSILRSIKIDATVFDSAIDAWSAKVTKFNDRVVYGNLLLAADHGDLAEASFRALYKDAQSQQEVTASAEGIARSLRSQDGNLRRANSWLASLEQSSSSVVGLLAALHPSDSQALKNSTDSTSNEDAIRLEKARAFILSMCADHQGNVWVGTEQGGVQRFNPNADATARWTQFDTKDGLGDESGYALACDHRGRIWVGHLNHGLSVYDGKKWQNYAVVSGDPPSEALAGPIGERVFCISVCPTDGDVWIATNAGLTRYSDQHDNWTYYTRAGGLPSDQANCIAFDAQGDIFVGTQCDGIAISKAADDYEHWSTVSGPIEIPRAPTGDGLPSASINDLVIAKDGTVFAATNAGLSYSADGGQNWRFTRGADWEGKLKESNSGLPKGWRAKTGAIAAEDHIMTLSAGVEGTLYAGYWLKGWQQLQRTPGGDLAVLNKNDGNLITCFCSTKFGSLSEEICGTYGGGIDAICPEADGPHHQVIDSLNPGLPSSALPPNLQELNSMLREMSFVQPMKAAKSPVVVPLADDWSTEGDWLGRYGRYWSLLAAVDKTNEGYEWGAGPEKFSHWVGLGNQPFDKGFLRYWIADYFTDDHRALEIPPVYLHSRIIQNQTTWDKNREQAEWDDHGEAYSNVHEGPGIDMSVNVPEGVFIMSLYEVNNDAHSGRVNPRRDYSIIVRDQTGAMAGGALDNAASIAHSRVENFWGGVYKRFVVTGPANLRITLQRDYSFNTIFNAIMFDLPDEHPVGYFMPTGDWLKSKEAAAAKGASLRAEFDSDPSKWNVRFDQCATEEQACSALIEKIQEFQQWNPVWSAQNDKKYAVLLARWYQSHQTATDATRVLQERAAAFYEAGMYSSWEDCETKNHVATARQIEKSLRWDGVTDDNSGRGYQTVQGYLETTRKNGN